MFFSSKSARNPLCVSIEHSILHSKCTLVQQEVREINKKPTITRVVLSNVQKTRVFDGEGAVRVDEVVPRSRTATSRYKGIEYDYEGTFRGTIWCNEMGPLRG